MVVLRVSHGRGNGVCSFPNQVFLPSDIFLTGQQVFSLVLFCVRCREEGSVFRSSPVQRPEHRLEPFAGASTAKDRKKTERKERGYVGDRSSWCVPAIPSSFSHFVDDDT